MPTELNPRLGAGLFPFFRAAPQTDLPFLNRALIEREPIDWQPRVLEKALRKASLQTPSAGGMALTDKHLPDETFQITQTLDGWGRTEFGDIHVTTGPSMTGGIVFVRFNTPDLPLGPPSAPMVAEILGFLDHELDLGLGPLLPMSDVF